MSGEREPDEDDRARGQRLGALRAAAGFKRQDDLAARMGIERTRYNRMETGKDRLTSPDAQALLAEALGITRGALVDYLAGTTTIEEVLARRAGQWVERPERYSVVARFVEHLRARKQDEAAIVELQALVGDRKGNVDDEEIAALWAEAQSVARRRDKLLGLEVAAADAAPDASPARLAELAKRKTRRR